MLIDPVFVALRFESRDGRQVVFVPRGTAEWPARVARLR